MNILDNILSKKTLLTSLLIAVFFGGIIAFQSLGKLEDAEISVKTAVIITPYPGASAEEVELEVTDVLEKAVERLENIKDIQSRSLPGMSEITVNIDTKVTMKEMPQLWDHLRRKVGDAKRELPHGVMDPIVVDDFGDVYGIFISVSSDGYTYREMNDYADYIRRALLQVDGIKRIELFGEHTETIEIRFSEEKLSGLGVNPMLIVQALNDQSSIVNPGSIRSGNERIRLSVGNKFQSIEEIKNLMVQIPGGGNFRLGDIATVERSLYEPASEGFQYNGKQAMGLALSMEKGVNVIEIGEAFDAKVAELTKELPVGIEINKIFYQPERVDTAIQGFMINLVESVLIVIVVLLFAMGFRSGLLISSGLVFTILGTFIVMLTMGVQLQRISLAAIIVAMGMLVDNSIVVADGILIDLKHGKKRKKAFVATAKKTAIPLFGATLVAILAFLPLVLSPSGAGEYLSSLFTVLAVSLLLSWIFAMIQTPFMAKWFYRKDAGKNSDKDSDPYDNKLYRGFGKMIRFILLHKKMSLTVVILTLVLSFYSFRFVNILFMPELDYNQFVVEYFLPQGEDISEVEEDLNEIQNELVSWDDVQNLTMSLGRTPARYNLLRPMTTSSQNYGEFIVDVKDYETSKVVGKRIQEYINKYYPQARVRIRTYSPVFSEYQIEAMFTGADPAVLRELADQAKEIMRNEPMTGIVTDNWKNKVKVLSPNYSPELARKLSISRKDLAQSMAVATNGMPIGVFYEGKNELPILLRMEHPVGKNIDRLYNIPVWGNRANSVPLAQVVDSVNLRWENEMIRRYNGQRAIKAQCDPKPEYTAPMLYKQLKDKVEAISLPEGYKLEWHGNPKESAEANKNLFKFLPLALGLMVLIIIALFNNFKQPIIVFSVVPMAFIGVIIGYLVTGVYFNFIGIIGSLGLIGMMIKNAVVLLDQINLEISEGKEQLEAVIDSVISRMRPVFMASLTTILGMLPLLTDVMFKSMAVAIMFGLLVGTVITLLVIPVLYCMLYRVDTSQLNRVKTSAVVTEPTILQSMKETSNLN